MALAFVTVALPVAHSSEESSAVAKVPAVEDPALWDNEDDESLKDMVEFKTRYST